MTAFTLCKADNPGNFKVGRSKIVWETIKMLHSEKCRITRITKEGGKPFMLGLRYKIRYIHPDTEIEIVGACPYCGDKDCTSDHK